MKGDATTVEKCSEGIFVFVGGLLRFSNVRRRYRPLP